MLSQDTIDYFAKLDLQVSPYQETDSPSLSGRGLTSTAPGSSDRIQVEDALTHSMVFNNITEQELWHEFKDQAQTQFILNRLFERLYRLHENGANSQAFEKAFTTRSWAVLVMLQHHIFGSAEDGEVLPPNWKEVMVDHYKAGQYLPFFRAKNGRVHHLEQFEAYLIEKEHQKLHQEVPDASGSSKGIRL